MIWVLLRPETSTPRLRRGRYLELCAWKCAEPPQRLSPEATRVWNFDPSLPEARGRYAQVVPSGRNADDIRGSSDLNRPFVVRGEFSDEELISLVDFVRMMPQVPGNSSEAVRGDSPISSMSRSSQPPAVTVILEPPGSAYQTVVLSRPQGTWVVSHTGVLVY